MSQMLPSWGLPYIHKSLRFANSPTFFNFFPFTTFFNFYFCEICCFYTVGVEAGFRLCSGSGSGSMLFLNRNPALFQGYVSAGNFS